jgi:2Fe-2S ferredoxin
MKETGNSHGKITYISHDGTGTVEAKNGESVMEAAIKNSIPGIDADCGGACACATCHVYVDEAFMDKAGVQEEMEKSMLDLAENAKPNSRLSCQITVSDALNGLRVTTPQSQH